MSKLHFSGKAAPRITAIFWRTHFSGKAAPRITAIFWRTHFSGKAAPRITAIFWRTHFSGKAAPPNNRSEEPPNNRYFQKNPHQTPQNSVAPRISEELHFRPKLTPKLCLTRGASHIKFFSKGTQELGRKISTKLLVIFIS